MPITGSQADAGVQPVGKIHTREQSLDEGPVLPAFDSRHGGRGSLGDSKESGGVTP